MSRKKNNGMWIRQTELSIPRKNINVFSLLIVLAAAGLFLLALAELTGFNVICEPWVMVLAAGATCIVCQFSKGTKPWMRLVLYLAAFVFVCLCSKQIVGGACLFWNQMGDTWTSQTGIVVPALEIDVQEGSQKVELLLFSIFLGAITALAFWYIGNLERRLLAVLLPIMLLGGMILFRCDDMPWYLVPMLLLSMCLLLQGSREDIEQPLAVSACRWGMVLLCSGILLIGAMQPAVLTWTAQVGEKTQESIHHSRYETDYTTLPEGDFSEYKESSGQAQPALVVNMEQPEALYLRGFTGAVFAEDGWQPLETKALEASEDLLYWRNMNGLNPHSQYAFAASLTMDEETRGKNTQNITVQNINACSRYMYVPYTLWDDGYLEPQYIGTDGVTGKGQRTYTYKAMMDGGNRIESTTSHLLNGGDDKIKSYLEVEQPYREFVYDHYMEIPESVWESLGSYWEKAAKTYGGTESLTSGEAQKCVLDFLQQAFPEDEDGVKLSLPLDMAEGSSYQYATVAALTLRYFGMPSRYVEGYYMTEEMVKAADEGGSIQVDSSYGGAWVEVYKDGLGWIPMQEMPGMENQYVGINPNLEDEKQQSQIPQQQEIQQEQPEIQEDTEMPEGGSVVTIEQQLSLTFLWGFIPIVCILLLLVVRRKIKLKERFQRWNGESVNDAVGWIFADTADLLGRLGFHRGTGSMRKLLIPVREKLGEAYEAELEKTIDLNDRANFSSKPMTEEMRENAKSFYDATLQQLTKDAKWHKKLWMRWILCLY